ncbi:hypothetical protein ACYOEI_04390, partial [Singulisphaera rosea]
LLQKAGGDAIPFLLSVQREHPDDFWVNHLLGFYAECRNDNPEALRNDQAALAIRPDTPYLLSSLGRALARADRMAEAIAYHRKATHLAPGDPILRMSLGASLMEVGEPAEAAEQFERGLELRSETSMQQMLRDKLLRCRLQMGDVTKADALWRSSLEAKPPRHETWDGYAEFCLFRRQDGAYRAACLGLLHHFGGTEDPFIAERTARACLLTPVSGDALQKATALIDLALADPKSKPDWVRSYFLVTKGLSEYRAGRWASAVAIMDGPASMALQPVPRLISAMARHRLGRDAEALDTFADAVLSTDWRMNQAIDRENWIAHILRREAEAMLLPNFNDFGTGRYQPRSLKEKVGSLGVCQSEGRYANASSIYGELLAADARLANDLNAGIRYRAACIAALAGAGLGVEGAGLDSNARLRWRQQSRDWLRDDLNLAKRLSETNVAVGLRGFLSNRLKAWKTDPDLAGLRDPNACNGLSPAEQRDFQDLIEALKALVEVTKN